MAIQGSRLYFAATFYETICNDNEERKHSSKKACQCLQFMKIENIDVLFSVAAMWRHVRNEENNGWRVK
jgi:hypothetical protein